MSKGFTRRGFGGLAVAGVLAPTVLRAQTALTVAAVNYPLAYFAERIGGDLAEVSFPVPAGTDPSFWRPSITDIGAIQSADLILLNGASFADWTARTTLPRARVVQTSAAFDENFISTATVTHSHGDGGEHSHTGTASYVWLDFGQATQQAITIANAMTRKAPDAADQINANLDSLLSDLEALDTEALAIGEALAEMPVICSHPRYQYFGRAYGLTMDAVDWDVAEPATEDQWAELEELAVETQAKIFIWEAEPGEAARDRIAALGLTNVVFPPLANRPAEGDFLTSLQASLVALAGVADA